jgi:exodeoxyribonuclease III
MKSHILAEKTDFMKIVTYNVNGIRAAIGKGFFNWLSETNADVVCLQEIKAMPEQIPLLDFELLGYSAYWFPAMKKGYSGVAILSKQEPGQVVYGMNHSTSDAEGRFLMLDFGNLNIASVYVPSGSSGEVRQDYKMLWLDDFYHFVLQLKKSHPNLIISGDYNICHQPIDIHDPVRNAQSSGFLPEERDWLTKFINLGFTDAFRYVNKNPHHYTWWSYRANARNNNKGWRIDYHLVSDEIKHRISGVSINPNAYHSDHCPVILELIDI